MFNQGSNMRQSGRPTTSSGQQHLQVPGSQHPRPSSRGGSHHQNPHTSGPSGGTSYDIPYIPAAPRATPLVVLAPTTMLQQVMIPPVSRLQVEIMRKTSGALQYSDKTDYSWTGTRCLLKRSSGAYHIISRAAHVAFSLLWTREGQEALGFIGRHIVREWKENQDDHDRDDSKVLMTRLIRDTKEEFVPVYVDMFLRKCHSSFPRLMVDYTPDGACGYTFREPWNGSFTSVDPKDLGRIKLNYHLVEHAEISCRIVPENMIDEQQAERNRFTAHIAMILAHELCHLFMSYLSGGFHTETPPSVVVPSLRPETSGESARVWETMMFGNAGYPVMIYNPNNRIHCNIQAGTLYLRHGNRYRLITDDKVDRFTRITPDFTWMRATGIEAEYTHTAEELFGPNRGNKFMDQFYDHIQDESYRNGAGGLVHIELPHHPSTGAAMSSTSTKVKKSSKSQGSDEKKVGKALNSQSAQDNNTGGRTLINPPSGKSNKNSNNNKNNNNSSTSTSTSSNSNINSNNNSSTSTKSKTESHTKKDNTSLQINHTSSGNQKKPAPATTEHIKSAHHRQEPLPANHHRQTDTGDRRQHTGVQGKRRGSG